MYPKLSLDHLSSDDKKKFLKERIMEIIGGDQKTSVQLAVIIRVHQYELKYPLMELVAEGLLYNDVRGSKLYLYYKPKRHPLDEIFNHNLNIPQNKILETHKYTEKNTKHNLRHNVTVDSFDESALASEGVKIRI
jgi:hypothetical protein